MSLRFFVTLTLSLLATSVVAQEVRPAPEAASGVESKSLVIAQRHMVVAAEPAAAEAGREILRQGGSAVDAAIATELVLGLVEPQSSGLGGGAFLVLWDAKTRAVKTFDGRETAPADRSSAAACHSGNANVKPESVSLFGTTRQLSGSIQFLNPLALPRSPTATPSPECRTGILRPAKNPHKLAVRERLGGKQYLSGHSESRFLSANRPNG